ncbi:hypothetical protein A167_01052 [Alcanivorax sp. S71-1-4]|nr:hypothetical protein A167_01052 [Alcanivorax sp. S71-1-4]
MKRGIMPIYNVTLLNDDGVVLALCPAFPEVVSVRQIRKQKHSKTLSKLLNWRLNAAFKMANLFQNLLVQKPTVTKLRYPFNNAFVHIPFTPPMPQTLAQKM